MHDSFLSVQHSYKLKSYMRCMVNVIVVRYCIEQVSPMSANTLCV